VRLRQILIRTGYLGEGDIGLHGFSWQPSLECFPIQDLCPGIDGGVKTPLWTVWGDRKYNMERRL